ncbi:MAG: penicillin-binding protein 1A [Pseudomonadota bacterium]
MRVYTRDGELIGQFGEQKRNPLTFDEIPQPFIDALLAAEDSSFFSHSGVDLGGLMRAVSELVLTGEKGSGGSTLTMQVARNYFLTLERTFVRKFNEILLAIEIERRLSKKEIFELYVNRVFLGHRAYGFGAAAQVYYGKPLSELDLAQFAMLAGVPKSPSRNNPISGPEAGKERRDWILGRMLTLGYIDQSDYRSALAAPVTARHHGQRLSFAAHYAAEMVRQEMLDRYGTAAYNDGYEVYTTIDSSLQQVARSALINGLLTYDDRHGYRGPERRLGIASLEDEAETRRIWLEELGQTATIAGLFPAVVTEVGEDQVSILLADGNDDVILWDNGIKQAAPYINESRVAGRPETPADVLSPGDLVRIKANKDSQWQLLQVPAAQAALVSLNPENGALISIVGGIGFELSKFNRATQAKRQPGSSFKPFLYGAALESGFTAASIINDAPVVVDDDSLGEGMWRPENDGGRFYGPTRLRWALTKSRNLVSIRLLQQLGVENLLEYVGQFGIDTSSVPRDLSLALGTHVMSVMEVATAYAVLANGGFLVEPYLIDRILDLDGEEIYQARPMTVCQSCEEGGSAMPEELSMEQILAGGDQVEDSLPIAPRIMDPRAAFVIDSILKDVITKGTGSRALVLERSDIAGKTGTTNGPMDAWFSGYNPDVVTTTWVGFDNYTPLGRREFGGTAALPIWIDFMKEALKDLPVQDRRVPNGLINVRIDPDTGLLASPGQPDAVFEYFPEETVPGTLVGEDRSTPGVSGTDDLVRDIF